MPEAFKGYTGAYRGRPVSVMASGMGLPSMGIYSHELFCNFGVKNIIRIGSCGALQENIKLKDLVLIQGASTDASWGGQFHVPGPIAALAFCVFSAFGTGRGSTPSHNFLSVLILCFPGGEPTLAGISFYESFVAGVDLALKSCGMTGQCQNQNLIETDGSVYPCDFYVFDQWRLGNINPSSCESMNGSPVLQCFLDRRAKPQPPCEGCAYWKICGGGRPRMEKQCMFLMTGLSAVIRRFQQDADSSCNKSDSAESPNRQR